MHETSINTARLEEETYQEGPVEIFVYEPRQKIVLRGSVQADKVGEHYVVGFSLHLILQLVTKPRFRVDMVIWCGKEPVQCLDRSSCGRLKMQNLTVSGQKGIQNTCQ